MSAIETDGYSYITKMGAHLFSAVGSVDHGHVEDGDLEKHFKKQMWPTQLRSIRSQVTKSTLDDKCEEQRLVWTSLTTTLGPVRNPVH